jgi:CHRD domain
MSHSRLRRRRAGAFALALGLALAVQLVAASPSRAAICQPPYCLWAQLTSDAVVPGPGLARLADGGGFTLVFLRDPDALGIAGVAPPASWPAIWFSLLVGQTDLDDVVTAVDIHAGRAGVEGGVVLTLISEPWPSNNAGQPLRLWEGYVLDVDPSLWDQLIANPADYYVDVHMDAYPDGALRGQLRGTNPDTAMAPPGRTVDVLVLIGALSLLLGAVVVGVQRRRPGTTQ